MKAIELRNTDNQIQTMIDLSVGLQIPSAILRRDLIKRAFDKIHASGRQVHEPKSTAGHRHSVKTRGKGTGSSRVQRKKDSGDAAQSPNNVGGRRAHPPRRNAKPWKSINRKENRLAILNCLAASLDPETVYSRSENTCSFVLSDEVIETIHTTKAALELFERLGFAEELEYTKARSKIFKPGRGKFRGRLHRHPQAFLLVVGDYELPIVRAVAGLKGIECITGDDLNVRSLAPGGRPGRLIVFEQSVFNFINEKY